MHPSAWIYFCTYILLVAYLLFNLLVAIVLQQFHMEVKTDDDDDDDGDGKDADDDGDGDYYNLYRGAGNSGSGGGGGSKIATIGGDEMACFQVLLS